MDYVVYEDQPPTDIWIKLVFVVPPTVLLIPALTLLKPDAAGASYFIYGAASTGILMAILFVFTVPTRYCILNDRVRIEFRGPFAFNVPFNTITGISNARWSTVGINFPTNLSQSNVLEISRRRRMAVTITPADKQAFADNFRKIFQDWKQQKGLIA